MDARIKPAEELAESNGREPEAKAAAPGGSLVSGTADERSDIDLYVYLAADLPMAARVAMANARAGEAEVGATLWERGDEWVEAPSGQHVDLIYRDSGEAEDQLERVLRLHPASVGFYTCI